MEGPRTISGRHLRPRSGPAARFAVVVGTAAVGARARRVTAAAANGRGGRPVAPRPVVARPRGHVDGRRCRLDDRRRVHGGVAACRRRAAECLGVMHFHGANDDEVFGVEWWGVEGAGERRSTRRKRTNTDDAHGRQRTTDFTRAFSFHAHCSRATCRRRRRRRRPTLYETSARSPLPPRPATYWWPLVRPCGGGGRNVDQRAKQTLFQVDGKGESLVKCSKIVIEVCCVWMDFMFFLSKIQVDLKKK